MIMNKIDKVNAKYLDHRLALNPYQKLNCRIVRTDLFYQI